MVLRESPILGTAHYLSVKEGAAKKEGGEHMNFHVDSRGVTFNLGFLAGEGLMFKLFQ